jgi:transposase
MTATDAKWTERIRQWKESGKTAAEFAEGQPFKASTLKWRAAELRRAAEGGRRYGKGHVVGDSVRLARVVSVPRARESAPAQGSGVVVEVSGTRIPLSRGFDAELLVDVVRALGALR